MITAKQTSIVVDYYEPGSALSLEQSFTLYDKVSHRTYLKGIIYDPETGKMILPRGIDLSWLEYQLNEPIEIDHQYDPFDVLPTQLRLRYKPRNDKQRETLEFMLGRGDKSFTKFHSQLCVNNNTGEGKTWACITTAVIMNLRSIVITSNIDWLNQWKERILEYTDISPREICFVKGSATLRQLMEHGADQYRFILVSHSTLASYAKTNGWDAVGDLFKRMKIGIKFYDEAHIFFDNMCNIDFHTNTYKTYYVSATLSRSSEGENRIFKFYIKNIPSICLFDPDSDPHTKYTAILFNSLPNAQQIADCKNVYGLDRNKYTNYVVEQDNFILLLHIIMSKVVMYTAGKVLMYIGTNAAIDKVKAWLEDHYPMFSYGVYTSVTKKEDKQAQLDKKIILSTTKSAGAAMDIAGLELTIVLAEPFRSEVLARQTLGRTRAANTQYIEVVDNSFRHTRKFYDKKKPVFDKYASSCEEQRFGNNYLKVTAEECIKLMEERIFPFISTE